ncbi:MAG: ImmA/IrrE family metallo-endopeptidase [Candidatus Nitrotoga sp.]
METLQLSPEILEWAADQAGSSIGEIARKISNKKTEAIALGQLTNAQAIKFSKLAGVPFGFLFLDTPPVERSLPIADFRTTMEAAPLSKDFFDTYDEIEYKQTWYRQYLESEHVAPLKFVSSVDPRKVNVKLVARNIRETLELSDEEIQRQKNPDALYGLLAGKAEKVGILVFKNGVVGNNTHRTLSVNEFRGFVISDKLAPAIFINGTDAPAAWVFTLVHELAHIWLGESGVSDNSPNSTNAHERLCNAIAAEVLIPAERFLQLWKAVSARDDNEKFNFVRSQIKVSTLMIARRALELNCVTRAFYEALYLNIRGAKKKGGSGGGDFYKTFAIRNSKTFSRKVTSLAVKGVISFREAGNLLNTNPNNVMTFYAQQRTISN